MQDVEPKTSATDTDGLCSAPGPRLPPPSPCPAPGTPPPVCHLHTSPHRIPRQNPGVCHDMRTP
jgi:hypothetical protein